MSPVRIEQRFISNGFKITTCQSSIDGSRFNVGPARACDILDLSRTTLFRHDGPDITRIVRGSKRERVYSDEALLRIALETKRVSFNPTKEGTRLRTTNKTQETVTDLDIPWEATQKLLRSKEK